ncbi:endonuclease/exonuclease/phosphatase family protein [Candidatus Harpocratesius sp.]
MEIQKISEKVYFQGFTIMIILVIFYQMMSDLVEGIYTLDLLNTQLDAKAAGVLFFLTGALLWLIPKRNQHWWIRGIFGIMMISRVAEPFMSPTGKIISAGIAVGCFWLGFPLYFNLIYNEYAYMFINEVLKGKINTQNGKETKKEQETEKKQEARKEKEKWQKSPDKITSEILSFALACASLFIISFRTWGATLDISLMGFGLIIGFLLVIGGIYFITKAAHTEMILDQVNGLTNVILMGDFNWREDSSYYSSVTAVYQDSWRAKWPTGIDNEGISMQSTIDHIFLSPTFIVESAHYIPSPQSQTDHPAYWIEISW